MGKYQDIMRETRGIEKVSAVLDGAYPLSVARPIFAQVLAAVATFETEIKKEERWPRTTGVRGALHALRHPLALLDRYVSEGHHPRLDDADLQVFVHSVQASLIELEEMAREIDEGTALWTQHRRN